MKDVTLTIQHKNGRSYRVNRSLSSFPFLNNGFYGDNSFITVRDDQNMVALINQRDIETITADIDADEYLQFLVDFESQQAIRNAQLCANAPAIGNLQGAAISRNQAYQF